MNTILQIVQVGGWNCHRYSGYDFNVISRIMRWIEGVKNVLWKWDQLDLSIDTNISQKPH
jgi:hypothetical protein